MRGWRKPQVSLLLQFCEALALGHFALCLVAYLSCGSAADLVANTRSKPSTYKLAEWDGSSDTANTTSQRLGQLTDHGQIASVDTGALTTRSRRAIPATSVAHNLAPTATTTITTTTTTVNQQHRPTIASRLSSCWFNQLKGNTERLFAACSLVLLWMVKSFWGLTQSSPPPKPIVRLQPISGDLGA
jgi:hypothetical protein